MTAGMLLGLSLLLMLAGGVFVAAEFSFVTVDRASIEHQAAAGDARARGTLQALRHLSTQLSGAQLGITLTNLGIGYLAEPAIGDLLHEPFAALGVTGTSGRGLAYAVALTLSTVVTMLVGELIPKNVAIVEPEATAKFTQLPQRAFTNLMRWPIRVLNGCANAVLRLINVEPQEELRSARTPIELRSLVLRSASQGALDDPTAELVARSITFGDRTAADVRTPRVRVTFLDGRDTALTLVDAARKTGHSRFPVIGRGPDDIIGVVHVKEAFGMPPERRRNVRLADLAVTAATVPDSIELDPLLTLLRDQGMQMAVVIDEYGGTDGVVTLEDLVEEIVGDIADEHDRVAAGIRYRGDGSWSLSGMLRPDEVAEKTGIHLPENDDYETIAGLILQVLGRIPQRGDVVEIDLSHGDHGDEEDEPSHPEIVYLRVDRMDGRRIDRVVLSQQEAE